MFSLPTRPGIRLPTRIHNENTHLAYKTRNQVADKQREHMPCLQDPESGCQQGCTMRTHTLPTRPGIRSPTRTHKRITHLAYKTRNQVADNDTQQEHTPCLQDPESGHRQARTHALLTRPAIRLPTRIHNENTHLAYKTRNQVADKDTQKDHTPRLQDPESGRRQGHNKNTHLAYKTRNHVANKGTQ